MASKSREEHENYKKELDKMRERYGDRIVKPLVKKAIEDGVLPKPEKPFNVEWPNEKEQDDATSA